jgi:hypothetical protein
MRKGVPTLPEGNRKGNEARQHHDTTRLRLRPPEEQARRTGRKSWDEQFHGLHRVRQ